MGHPSAELCIPAEGSTWIAWGFPRVARQINLLNTPFRYEALGRSYKMPETYLRLVAAFLRQSLLMPRVTKPSAPPATQRRTRERLCLGGCAALLYGGEDGELTRGCDLGGAQWCSTPVATLLKRPLFLPAPLQILNEAPLRGVAL